MRLWRLTRRVYADLTGEGAARYGGRWNQPGRPMVYTAAEVSLAVLEVRVHLDLPFELLPDDYVLMEIETGDASREDAPVLSQADTSRGFVERWLAERRSALLAVPSMVVPQARNVLINPEHEEAVAITVVYIHDWQFDPRLC